MDSSGLRQRGPGAAAAKKGGTTLVESAADVDSVKQGVEETARAAAEAAAASEGAAKEGAKEGGKSDTAKDAGEKPKGKGKKKKKSQEPPLGWRDILGMGMTLVTLGVTIYSTSMIVRQMRLKPNPKKIWTAADLAKFDGSTPSLPLLLGCLGEVFDVSKGHKHYAKGQGYNHFCGRDATRAFVSGNFTGDGLTDDVSGLSYDNILSIHNWHEFYHKTYKYAGKLVGRYYDAQGQPTKNLTRFQRQVKRAEEAKAKRDKEDSEYTMCNSYWSHSEGGKVYCETGFPRKLFSVMQTGPEKGDMTTRTRCVCLSKAEIATRGDLELYDGCDPDAIECQTSPPGQD